MTSQREAPVGARVQVMSGRWRGRTGTLVDWHHNPGSPGGQQAQSYPVVELERRGRARSRTVRVLVVERLGGDGWDLTDNSDDPCVYCVQWRPVGAEDYLEGDPYGPHEPYWPDGSVVPRVFHGVCDRCDEAIARYIGENDKV